MPKERMCFFSEKKKKKEQCHSFSFFKFSLILSEQSGISLRFWGTTSILPSCDHSNCKKEQCLDCWYSEEGNTRATMPRSPVNTRNHLILQDHVLLHEARVPALLPFVGCVSKLSIAWQDPERLSEPFSRQLIMQYFKMGSFCKRHLWKSTFVQSEGNGAHFKHPHDSQYSTHQHGILQLLRPLGRPLDFSWWGMPEDVLQHLRCLWVATLICTCPHVAVSQEWRFYCTCTDWAPSQHMLVVEDLLCCW